LHKRRRTVCVCARRDMCVACACVRVCTEPVRLCTRVAYASVCTMVWCMSHTSNRLDLWHGSRATPSVHHRSNDRYQWSRGRRVHRRLRSRLRTPQTVLRPTCCSVGSCKCWLSSKSHSPSRAGLEGTSLVGQASGTTALTHRRTRRVPAAASVLCCRAGRL
jgi:hypothetical protein